MTRGGRTRVRSGRQKRIQLTETWFEKMSVYQQVCPCPPAALYVPVNALFAIRTHKRIIRTRKRIICTRERIIRTSKSVIRICKSIIRTCKKNSHPDKHYLYQQERPCPAARVPLR